MKNKQQGAALIIMMLVLLMVAMSVMFSYLDGSSVKIERDKQAAQILAQAKDALLGTAVSAASNLERPGNLRIPDSFASSEAPSNYDGSSDGGCLNFTADKGFPLINSGVNMRCLGRLPWKDLGMHIQAPSESDPNGFMPWYAVSSNLVDPTCFSVFNSSALNLIYTPSATLDCSGAGLPYPWLTVRDGNGNVISNRVAAIIFIPNEPMGGQSRNPSPNLGMANQYLDTLVVPNDCVQPCVAGTYSNADMDNDFITTPSTSDFAKRSNFNDKLLYITIDELMPLLEKRVAGEVKQVLLKHKNQESEFPNAASLGYKGGTDCASNSFNLNVGFLPFIQELKCDGSKCQSDFSATVKFTSDKSYATSTGQCSFSSKVCTCTGAGSCIKTTIPARSFVCTKNGTCISNITGAFVYDLRAFSNLVGTGGCALVSGVGTCSSKGSINPASTCKNLDKTLLPEWFFNNEWKHFIYYAKGNLSVGGNSASAVVITTGAELGTQKRSTSNSISDYLDNPNPPPNYGITLFDAVGTPKSNFYNDQMFIVSPL